MSMPHEHTRAINKTYEFLKEIRQRDDIAVDVKESANWLLRHYPDPSTVESVGYAIMPNNGQNPFATSDDYEQHVKNLDQLRRLTTQEAPIMLWRNNKNQNIYKVIHYATDCTNSCDGAKVVVYCPVDKQEQVFVRDEAEFMGKFTKVY